MSSSSRSLVWRLARSQFIGDAETSDISEVVSSRLNLSALSLSPTCSQAARRRFHWTLIQINAVPVHHETENGSRCRLRQRRFRPADGKAFPRQVPWVIASCSRLNGDGDTFSVGDRIRFSIGGHALRQGSPREMTETRKLAAILAADVRLRGKPRPRTNR